MTKTIFTCNFGNYVELYYNNLQRKFLVDSGATISVIKLDALSYTDSENIHKNCIQIQGLGGNLLTEGNVKLELFVEDNVIQHDFHVLNNLPCDYDGIIGQDFLEYYRCVIDYERCALSLKNNNSVILIQLQNGNRLKNKSFEIPPRCEKYLWLDTDKSDDCVIFPMALGEGIFLAGSISKPKNGKIPVQVLNTREETVKISNFNPEIDDLNDYLIKNFEFNEKSPARVKKLLNTIDLSHLKAEERTSIIDICAKFADIFYLPGDQLSTTDIYETKIHVKPDASPVYTKQYRLPHAQKEELEKQLQNMLSEKIIEPASSEWSSPVLLVPKKSTDGNKKWRLVIDFRKLNERIVDDKFPLPNITDILDSLSGSVYFSHLDLNSGYYQLNLDRSSRPYTAFTTPSGQYQLTRLPMGLKTSPSSFSRAMTIAMAGLNYEKCFVYLDDLVCFGRSLDIHNKNLLEIFERLRKVNLKLNPQKCCFLKKELLYLGHVVSDKGISPDPDKIKTLKNYPEPKCQDEVRRFVAFSNYYRKFIPHFAKITIPLNNLLKKNRPFDWTSDCQYSFETLKQALTTTPILEYPDFTKTNTFILQTDASNTAIGAVLCNSNMKPIAYTSRPLNKAEQNYPTIQKELVAIVWSVKYFRPYLFGRRFIIQTDHKPLVYLFGMRDPTSRLLKFRLVLEEYDFTIQYIKGKDNVTADALSRINITSDELKNMNNQFSINVITRAQKKKNDEEERKKADTITVDKPTGDKLSKPKIVELIRKPNECVEMILSEGKYIKMLKENNRITDEIKCFALEKDKDILHVNLDFRAHFSRAEFVTELSNYCNKIKVERICIIKNERNEEFIKSICNEIKNKQKWKGPQICILRGVRRIDNNEEKTIILKDFHLLPTNAHAGVRRMTNNIKRKYYWSGIESDVKKLIKNCDKCQRMKHSRYTKEPMCITTTATYAFQRIYLDLVGPLLKDHDENCYILTLQCDLSKFIEAYAIKSKDSTVVARALVDNFILRYGVPESIVSDRGSEFISSTMEQVCKILEINKLSSTAYHHESIGSLENNHKHLGAFLRTQCENKPDTWSYWIPYWCFSYNNTVHTESKYTPFELVFGRACKLPNNLTDNVEPLYNPDNYALELKYKLQVAHKDAHDNLVLSKIKRKSNFDKNINPIVYKKNDYLLVKNETGTKLDALYNGPYLVIEDIEPNVKILKNDKIDTVHKNRTKPYFM